MAFDDTKSPGDLIDSNEYNNLIQDLKSHAARHKDGGVDELGVAELDGSSGSDGQFLQTDGATLSFASIQGGMTDAERQAFNDVVAAIARNEFANNLNDLNFDGGLFTVYRNSSEFQSTSNVNLKTLDSGDAQGTAELSLEGLFDVSTASFTKGLDVGDVPVSPHGLAFNGDGTKLFVAGGFSKLFEYTLSTGFDVTTADLTQTFDVSSQDGRARGVAFNNDGSKMFIVGNSNDNVYEYDLSTAFATTTASFTQSFDISSENALPSGVKFNLDGSKMFVVGTGGFNNPVDKVYEYSLSTGFDISTASFTQSFDVSSEDSNPIGIAFNNDGSKMFISGQSNAKLFEYDLSTSFDVSTASLTQSFDVSSQDDRPRGLAFNGDGSKIFVSGGDDNLLLQYSMGTQEFDVSTASFTDSFDVSSQEGTPAGVAFNDNGTKMFVTGRFNLNVYEYSLVTAFDVSTASFTQSFDISSQVGGPDSLAFNDNGRKMFIVGNIGIPSNVSEYDVGSGELVSSGNLTLNSKNLSKQENGGFSSPPSSVVVSQNANLPNNTDITYTVRDGNGNTVTLTQSDVDTQVDTSNFTSTTVEADVNMSQSRTNNDATPVSDDVMLHLSQ